MTEQEAHYIVELNGQSHETDRNDLANSDVITVPVVGGPYQSREIAEQRRTPSHQSSIDGYAVVTVLEDDPDFVYVEEAPDGSHEEDD